MKKYAFLVPLALGVVLAGVVLTAGQSGETTTRSWRRCSRSTRSGRRTFPTTG